MERLVGNSIISGISVHNYGRISNQFAALIYCKLLCYDPMFFKYGICMSRDKIRIMKKLEKEPVPGRLFVKRPSSFSIPAKVRL